MRIYRSSDRCAAADDSPVTDNADLWGQCTQGAAAEQRDSCIICGVWAGQTNVSHVGLVRHRFIVPPRVGVTQSVKCINKPAEGGKNTLETETFVKIISAWLSAGALFVFFVLFYVVFCSVQFNGSHDARQSMYSDGSFKYAPRSLLSLHSAVCVNSIKK